MPTIIAIPEVGMPAVIDESTDTALLRALDRPELSYVPEHAKRDVQALKTWLGTLTPPSGYFANAEEAKAYQDRIRRESRK